MNSVDRTVAFVTCEAFADLTEDDRLVVEPLRSLGIRVAAVRWDDGTVDWNSFDALVIRSTWDYYVRPAEFAAWLAKRRACPMWNPAAVIEWNLNKRYLGDLADNGIPVVETEWLHAGAESLVDLLSRRGWQRAVVKPSISAGGWRTHAVTIDDAADLAAEVRDLTADRAVMVQPFVDAITAEGEWSFIFFNGEFSHALIKRPAEGDYRVQQQYGGTSEWVHDPPRAGIDQAAAAAACAPGHLLYARVDGVMDGDRFVLLELEAFEPVLFFGAAHGSAARFASALANRIP